MNGNMTEYCEEHCRNILVLELDQTIRKDVYAAVSKKQHENDWKDKPRLEEAAVAREIRKILGPEKFSEVVAKREEVELARKEAEENMSGDTLEKLDVALSDKKEAIKDNVVLKGENELLRQQLAEFQKKKKDSK